MTPTGSEALVVSPLDRVASGWFDVDWFDDAGVVRAAPRDGKRFHDQLRRVLSILAVEPFAFDRFDDLLHEVATWISRHESRIKDGYLTIEDERLALVVVANEREWREDLVDALAEFDLRIAADLRFESLAFGAVILPDAPEESIRSFLDPRFCARFQRGEGPTDAE
jgi:hypothetical protein